VAAPSTGEFTRWLKDFAAGDQHALHKLLPLVYCELRTLAGRAMKSERRGHTLETTALVHEAYMRLVDQRDAQWQDRSHFLAIAAQMMRRILVDHARRRAARKREGMRERVGLESHLAGPDDNGIDLAAVDEAVSRLTQFDPPLGQLVELRYFGGLTIEETAEVLGTSPATVKRDWTVAKAWLRRELTDSGTPSPPN